MRLPCINPETEEHFPLLKLYEAYTNRWLERDVGRARLSREQRRRLSFVLADHMLWEGRENESWNYLREVIRGSDDLKSTPLTDEEAELDIRNSGFLIRDLDDRYRFIHRSIMEFFAAVAEVQRLRGGARPRHFPSDGFRSFLALQMAREWTLSSEPVFPAQSWEASRGDVAIETQLSMLAAASKHVPLNQSVRLGNVFAAKSRSDQFWHRVHFSGVRWDHAGARLAFGECHFALLDMTIKEHGRVSFTDCTFDRSKVAFEQFPTEWSEKTIDLDAQQAELELPHSVWEIAELVERGVEIRISGQPWRLKRTQLSLFAEAAHRLRGKTMKQNYSRGARRAELLEFLPILKRMRLVREDASRQGHQLELTNEAFSLIGRMQADPVAAHDEVVRLFKSERPESLKTTASTPTVKKKKASKTRTGSKGRKGRK